VAQAKNGDKLFSEEEFHAANRKAQASTQGGFAFFPFKFEGGTGGDKDFFSFFPVPNMFSLSSQWVPIRFSMCSPYALANVVLHLHRCTKGEKLYTSKENLLLFWGVYMV
jgi:hypothetical protein